MESLKRPASCLQNDGGMEPSYKRPTIEEIHTAVLKELQNISEYNKMQVSDPKYNALLRLWIALANNPKPTDHLSKAFFTLHRESAVAILSPDWKTVNSTLRDNFISAILMAGKTLAPIIDGCSILCMGLRRAALEPWENNAWTSVLNGNLDFDDAQVRRCLGSESEEISLARVQLLYQRGCDRHALSLAKNVFKFYSRIFKTSGNHSLYKGVNKGPTNGAVDYPSFSSADWLFLLLQKMEKLSDIVKETVTLNCHEGIQLIRCVKARNQQSQALVAGLINIFLVQDFMHPSKYCCTKELIALWCSYQEQQQADLSDIADATRKLLVSYASTSAHFYLFVDVLWEQFGSSLLSLYVEMYVRGLTADINFLEVARSNEMKDTVHDLETHIASVLSKLSTLFSDGNEEVSRECMLSAFSLRPTQERLYILQSLTHSILSQRQGHDAAGSTISYSRPPDKCSKSDCNCGVRCSVSHILVFSHPLLLKGIKGISYSIVKDLVSLLEGVRCNTFQFNSFDWHKAASDLGDYLNKSKKTSRTNLPVNDSNVEINPVSEKERVESYVCGINHFKSNPNFMPEGLLARSIPFQQFAQAVPLKEVKSPLTTFASNELKKLAIEKSNISSSMTSSSSSCIDAVNISQSLNISHSDISATALGKTMTERNFFNVRTEQMNENLMHTPENLSFSKSAPIHGEKAMALVSSRKSHSMPIILDYSASSLNNSLGASGSPSQSERAVTNSVCKAPTPLKTASNAVHRCSDYSPTYSHSTAIHYPLKVDRNTPFVGSKQLLASNFPNASTTDIQNNELPINYSNQPLNLESTRESHIVRNTSSFEITANDSQGVGHAKECKTFINKNFTTSVVQNEISHKASVIVHSDTLEHSRSHINANLKSEGSVVKNIRTGLSTLEQSVLSTNLPGNQQVYTQLPRIPVSVNPISRMTLEQLNSPQEKTYSLPAFKISVTPDIKKLSGNRVLSANLVIPRNPNLNTPGASGINLSDSINGAALSVGSSSNAISIPGVIVFKSSKDKGFSSALKVSKANVGSSDNSELPQKRIWTSYRSTFGELGWKKTGQRSSILSSPVPKVHIRPPGKLPYILYSKNANCPVILKPTQDSCEKPSLPNSTNDSPVLYDYSSANLSKMQPSASISSPLPSVIHTDPSPTIVTASSEPSSFVASRTPCVISVDGKALHGKFALSDGQRNQALHSSNFSPAFISQVSHNPSPGSNAFINAPLKVTSPNPVIPKQNETVVNFSGLKVQQSSPVNFNPKHKQGLSESCSQFHSPQKMCCSSNELVPCQSCSQSEVKNFGANMQTPETNFMPQQIHSTYAAGSSSMAMQRTVERKNLKYRLTNMKKAC